MPLPFVSDTANSSFVCNIRRAVIVARARAFRRVMCVEMEDQRADPLLVVVRSTGITVTPGKMVKWEYKLTDTLGDTVHIGASSIAGQRLHASMLVFIPHVCTWRYLLLA